MRPSKPKPIRQSTVIGRRHWNIPEEGYVTPRLRDQKYSTEAIGFTANLCSSYDDDED